MMMNAVRTIAESGRDVIVDNTHLSTRFPTQVRDELGDQFVYEIKDFTVVPLADCVEQDAVRNRLDPPGHVGEVEVRRQYDKGQTLQRLGSAGPGCPAGSTSSTGATGSRRTSRRDAPKALIVDIDGTLALHENRGPYDTSLYHTDELEKRLALILQDLNQRVNADYSFIVLTGRYEEHRDVTDGGSNDNGVYFDELHMRKDGDIETGQPGQARPVQRARPRPLQRDRGVR
jgi:hypothetical protein